MTGVAEHGGGIDAAITRWGGTRGDWCDLSTGINPRPYPVGDVPPGSWNDLPDAGAFTALETAARAFWSVPDGASVLAAPGASSLIARIPTLLPPAHVNIERRTYNEHEAAFTQAGWAVGSDAANARVIVHPNNPDGQLWSGADERPGDRDLLVIDESFCDVSPGQTHIAKAAIPGTIILKSFGKFWGLAGLRLGFAIGDPALLTRLSHALGPWQISGPALHIATRALADLNWANATRQRLAEDADRLDEMVSAAGLETVGGTPLFRLYRHGRAGKFQDHLARHHIWTRCFSYEPSWIRLGLPDGADNWARLQSALGGWG